MDSLRAALGDRYELGDEVARGGMATIYRALDRRHDRIVAVKVFDQALGSVVGLKRFQNEINIASTLQHPGLVPVFDSGGGGDVLYYTMPLIEGESLRTRLDREPQFPIADALQIAREVAGALAYAHSHGVVHRDIKPENIMLASGHAMVTDFGIARAIATAAGDRLTSSSLAIGTPTYMAPEQADSTEQIDGRADVYALGCVLYEMLAGDPPFTGRTAQAIVAKHFAERPPSLEVVRTTIPAGLQAAIARAQPSVSAGSTTPTPWPISTRPWRPRCRRISVPPSSTRSIPCRRRRAMRHAPVLLIAALSIMSRAGAQQGSARDTASATIVGREETAQVSIVYPRLPYGYAASTPGCASLPDADSVADLTAVLGIRLGSARLAAGTYVLRPNDSSGGMILEVCRLPRVGETAGASGVVVGQI
ncbi:MAG: serine/threonine-protein kinase, partial [Gemmatimonadales bacterium]